MKKLQLFQIDAFASYLFGGNPAAVCPLETWISDEQMQSIATENNLSETAFIVPQGNEYEIRWFTPNSEVALCGHATLASAFVLFECLGFQKEEILFHSKSGELKVKKVGDVLQMDFPALPFERMSLDAPFCKSLNLEPQEVYDSTFDLLFIFKTEQEVKEACPDLQAISRLNKRGVILSAPGTQADVYSRCFYPGCDVPEDPVTGSAHCVITPYWCERLGKKKINAVQGLKRQGELTCEIINERVILSGSCQLYLQGHLFYLNTPEIGSL